MARTEIQGDQVQDESLTGIDILNDSVKPIDVSQPVNSINSNYTITTDDYTIVANSGTSEINLPDATTLVNGRTFNLVNRSGSTIAVKDNAGATLANLINNDSSQFTLETNLIAAGTWLATVVTDAATGITSYVISSNTTFTTSSTTDVLVTGFTVTPVSGRYSVFMSADVEINANNAIAGYVIYDGGVAVENTRRQTQGVSSNYVTSFTTIGEVIVNGSQVIDTRVNISTSSLDVNNRSLVLIRLGGA